MTDEDASISELLTRLEQALMQPSDSVDSDERASELIDPDFLEIGKSGRLYDKASILEELRRRPEGHPPGVINFAVFRLSAELALVTYQTVNADPGGPGGTMRSSIWMFRNGTWRIRFHQGTPMRMQPLTDPNASSPIRPG